MIRITLYSRRDCPLCDEAKEALDHAQARVPFDLEVRAIESDAALRAAHSLEVPVVFVDGAKKFFGRVAPLLLVRRRLRPGSGATKQHAGENTGTKNCHHLFRSLSVKL